MAYPKAKVTQVRSTINRPKDQKATIQALGLGKIDRTVEKEVTPQILGMLKKVSHLVRIEPIETKEKPKGKEKPSAKTKKEEKPTETVEPENTEE